MTAKTKKRARSAPATSPVKVVRQTGLSFSYGEQGIDWSSDDPLRFDVSVSAKDGGVTLLQKLTRGNLIELRDLCDFTIKHTDREKEKARHGG